MSDPIVVVKLPRDRQGFITCVQAIHQHCTNNSVVKVPTALLDKLATETTAYVAACVGAAGGATGTAAERCAAKEKVTRTIGHIRDAVQLAAESQPTEKDAVAAIESAYMHARKIGKRPTPEISVSNTEVPGTVLAVARSLGVEAIYLWQYSQDQETWVDVPPTLRSKCTISGLTSLTRYFFRYRTTTRAAQGGYSPTATLVIE